ncbi:MAG: chemotaxis protein CheW [Desulfuromonadales bacterium]|nr:chemotaxis protein CheW [Desulfuromonadales bacterium]
MDLAEIRKKAKGKGGEVPAIQGAAATNLAPARLPDEPFELPFEPFELLEPVEPVELPLAAAASPRLVAPAALAAVYDPIAALFEMPAAVDLATEESYLGSLRQGSAQEQTDYRQLLTFSLGSEDYALDIGSIREIIKPREVTDIPRVPEFILGIISLRGIIIPVYDLKQRLKLGKTEISPVSRIIVSQHEERVVGLLVDSITQVVQVPKQKIEPPPAVLSGLDRDMVEGVGRVENRMMILLHLPCVVDAELV